MGHFGPESWVIFKWILQGLHWDKYLTAKHVLYSQFGDEISCKLTGGGNGGDFVVFTRKTLIPKVRDALSLLDVGIIYDSTKEDPPISRINLEKWSNNEDIAEVQHTEPLLFSVLTAKEESSKKIKSTEKFNAIFKAKEKLLESGKPPRKLILADKDDNRLNRYKLEKHGDKPSYKPTELGKRRVNKIATIDLLRAFAEKSDVQQKTLKINSTQVPRLAGKLPNEISSNITSPFGRNLVEENQRSPFTVKSNEPEQEGEATIKLQFPEDWGIVAISKVK